jgi:hypothetical protein
MTTIAAAANCISIVEDTLADCLASLATFQTWTGTGTDAAAKAKIYHDLILTADEDREEELSRRTLEGIRPFASIYWESFNLRRETSQGFLNPTHNLYLEFEDNFPESYRDTPRAAEREIKNSLGGIVFAFSVACVANPYLDLQNVSMNEGLRRSKPDMVNSIGDVLTMRFLLTCGGGGR